MLVKFNLKYLKMLRTISYLKVYSYPKLYCKKPSNQKPTMTLGDRVDLQNDIRKLFNIVCVFYGLFLQNVPRDCAIIIRKGGVLK